MRVSDCMTRDVRIATPTQSMLETARTMADLDVGVLPVGENDRLVGMITDRDIAVRGVASGLGPDTPIRQVMSDKVLYCYEDQSIEEVTQKLGDTQVRRLPVLNRDKRLVGIVSLGDVSQSDGNTKRSAEALREISSGRPNG
jgi:CBS domain-containing protein